MKKTLFLAVFAGVALAGCVKNEEVAINDTSPERIKFDAPVVSVPTRAWEITNDFPKDVDFAVYALYHDGPFNTFNACTPYMSNVTCKAKQADGSAVGTNKPAFWAPDSDYYWPKTEGAKLTFAAYSPVMDPLSASAQATDKGVKWDATGFTFQNFSVNDAPANQVDLLYSERVFNQTEDNMLSIPGVTETDKPADPYGGITIKFKHALSSIVFTAHAETEGTIKLTGITVNNIYSKGTFNQGITRTAGADNETPEWSNHKDLKSYTVYDGSSNTATLTASKESPMTFTTETPVAGKKESDLILLPQNLSKDDRTTENNYEVGSDGLSKDATVTITYKIKHDAEWKDQQTVYKLASGSKDSPAYKWEVNKRYTYDISIGLKKIYFNLFVNNFSDGTTVLVEAGSNNTEEPGGGTEEPGGGAGESGGSTDGQ